ncbi:MAG: hypothetical protein ACI9Y1_003284 [Lentisphaeria bacterium]
MPAEGDSDEGTIAISSVISSLPFDPERGIHCLRTPYQAYKSKGIYGEFGFAMSVNTSYDLVVSRADDFFTLINVLAIKNHLSGFI